MSLSYVYVLADPRDGEIRYVGITSRTLEQRLTEHYYAQSNDYRGKWLSKLRNIGLKPIMRLLQTFITEDALKAEIYWIKYFKDTGCKLINGTLGGEGALGRFHSKETKAKISESHKGKHLSEEHKAKLSEAGKGRVQSEDTKVKLSVIMRARPHNPEWSIKQAASLRGRIMPDDQREKISKAGKGRKLSEETKARMSAAQLKRYENPVERLRQSVQQLGHAVSQKALDALARRNALRKKK